MPDLLLPLGEIANIYVGLPTRASETREAGRSGNVLTVRSLTSSGIDRDNLTEVNVNGREVDKYRARSGDLLISARSTSLKTAVVPDELDGYLINATLLGVRCLPDLQPRLLAAWLNSPEGAASLEGISQSGTIQMNITVAGLSRIQVPVPDIATQRQMVQLLETANEAYVAAVQAAEDRWRIAQQVVVSQLLRNGNN